MNTLEKRKDWHCLFHLSAIITDLNDIDKEFDLYMTIY